jgi:hypothetical protein
MRKTPKESPLWKYLEACGVLEHGTDEQIKVAKRQYRKSYMLAYRKRERKEKPEYIINLSRKNGEFDTVARAAHKHSMPITAFIRKATLAYINKTYMVPDRFQVARLEQLLAQCLNEVQRIAPPKEKYSTIREQEKYNVIEKRIIDLQKELSEALRNPPMLGYHDSKDKIT